MHMGENKAIGIFLPPNAKVELAVNHGAVAAKPLCSFIGNSDIIGIKEKKMPENEQASKGDDRC